MHMVLREPIGVVGAISPWNYPLLMAVWKIAPALAAGNTVVLKPAEQAPMSCLRLAELFAEAGGPPGVFNVVNGMGEIAGKALALHRRRCKDHVHRVHRSGQADHAICRAIEPETGLPRMWWQVTAGVRGRLADLDRAVTAAYRGIFSNMGEVCNAGSRLLVDRAIYDRFVNASSSSAATHTGPAIRSTRPPIWARWLLVRRSSACLA